MKYTASLLAVAALGIAPVLAQGAAGSLPAQPDTRSGEKGAVTYIVQDSVADVQLANLALRKSQNPAARAFAQTLVADHTKGAAQAMQVAAAIGDSDAQLKPSDEGLIEEAHLARYSGTQFEQEWLQREVSMHQNDIDTVRDAMEISTTAAVRQLELATLRIDETHLRLANAALDEVERSSAAGR